MFEDVDNPMPEAEISEPTAEELAQTAEQERHDAQAAAQEAAATPPTVCVNCGGELAEDPLDGCRRHVG
jgi:hypothetical protein